MLKGILPINTLLNIVSLGSVLSTLPAVAATFVPLDLSFPSPLNVPTGPKIVNRTYYYDAAQTIPAGTFTLRYNSVTLNGNQGPNRPSGNSSGDLAAGIRCSPISCTDPVAPNRNQSLTLTFTPLEGFTLPQVRIKAPSLTTAATVLSDNKDYWDATSTNETNNTWSFSNPTPVAGGPVLDNIYTQDNYIAWSYNGIPGTSYPARNGLWSIDSRLGISQLSLTYYYLDPTTSPNNNAIGIQLATLKITEIPEPSALLGLGLLGLGGLLSKVHSPRSQSSRKQSKEYQSEH